MSFCHIININLFTVCMFKQIVHYLLIFTALLYYYITTFNKGSGDLQLQMCTCFKQLRVKRLAQGPNCCCLVVVGLEQAIC